MSARITKPALMRFIRYGINSACVLGIKLLLAVGLMRVLDAYAAYFIVHIIVFFVSYYIHSRHSFSIRMSWRSMKRYFWAVIAMKLLDYVVFVLAFGYFKITAIESIILATLVIAVIRFFVAQRALTQSVN